MAGATQSSRLFELEEADRMLPLIRSIVKGMHDDYRERQALVERLEAGRAEGDETGALDVLDVDEKGHEGKTKRVVFTGDLGRRNMPILRDPEIPASADFLITESTYGDRTHAPIEAMDDALADVLARAHGRGGKVVIPSFALERAQEIVFALKRLKKQGRMPPMGVYVDSPLTVKITDVFRMHADSLDIEARKWVRSNDSPFDFPGLTYVSDVEESKQLDLSPEPAVIISASGMCESGRVIHHLKATVEGAQNTILIVGYQAPHTLGRRLVEKRPRVRIWGVERERRAEVVVLNGFSAHADQKDLIDFAEALRDRGPLRQVALVHGDPKAQQALDQLLRDRRFPTVHIPAPGDRVRM